MTKTMLTKVKCKLKSDKGQTHNKFKADPQKSERTLLVDQTGYAG